MNCTKLINVCLPQFTYHLLQVTYKIINWVSLDSVRNYAVLNIVVDESKVYCTKERAPFALCFEIYRPEEFISIF